VVLVAPDMDADLAPAKIYRIFSDPDRPFGQAPAPHAVPPVSTYFKVTIYVSPDDRALAGSSWLSGSLVRLDLTMLSSHDVEQVRASGLSDVVR